MAPANKKGSAAEALPELGAIAPADPKTAPKTLPETLPETAPDVDPDQLDDVFKDLKSLLSTVEKLQKARSEVGDLKPQLTRLLDGELLSEAELDQLRSGVSGLAKLVKLYSDYQTTLERAQPARDLLDTVLKA